MAIITDSTPLEEPKDPDRCNVMALLKLVAEGDEADEWQQRYRQGGTGYGQAKRRLVELLVETFAPYRKRRKELEGDPNYIEQVLADGAKRARAVARETIQQVREATGITYDAGKSSR